MEVFARMKRYSQDVHGYLVQMDFSLEGSRSSDDCILFILLFVNAYVMFSQVSQEQIPIQQRGQLITLTTISSKHSHHLQPLLVDQLQPKLMDKVAVSKTVMFLICGGVDALLFFVVVFVYRVNSLQRSLFFLCLSCTLLQREFCCYLG